MFTYQEVADALTKAQVPSKFSTLVLSTLDNVSKQMLAESIPLPFGKHKGKSLQELLKDDVPTAKRYCQYLIRAKDENDVFWVKENFPDIFEEAQDILETLRLNKKRARGSL